MNIFSLHPEIRTLVDLLQWRARSHAKQLAYVFMTDGVETARLTYEDLDSQARIIGGFLQSQGKTGSRVLLLYPPGLDYITAFFGCLYAGAVAIPSYPPRLNRPDPRLQGIVNDSQASIALTLPPIRANIERRFDHTPELAAVHWEVTDQLDNRWREKWHTPQISGDTLAFLQYTSGSTSAPKGVMVTHGNILQNEQMIQQGFQHDAESIVAGWLPIYHDMGLIGNVLQPLYVGAPCYLMSPTEFLQNPYNWLKLLSDTQAHTSGGPNFAYDLCVEKITPEQRQTLDLSHWQVAFNGAEPVRAQTLERFSEVFAPCGFRKEAFYPCYGLAETTLFVSGRKQNIAPIKIVSVQADALAQNQVKAAPQEDVEAHKLVSSGGSWLDEEIVIVNSETRQRCAPDEVGEIWVSGEHVAQGYWQRPEASLATFGATLADTAERSYLRTGDLGFLQDGELFVTGRIKDLLIIRGRNHYPQDIELTIEQAHPALQSAGSAAFTVEVEGEEQLVVVCEAQRTSRHVDIEEVAQAARQAVAEQHELQLYGIVLLKPGYLPRTSSGKVQRGACRIAFLDGTLTELGRDILNKVVTTQMVENEFNREQFFSAVPDERRSLLKVHLLQQAGRILKISPQKVALQQPLISLGLDSLAAIEFQNILKTRWEANIPLENLLGELTLEKLTDHIFELTLASQHLTAQPRLTTVTRDQNLPLSFDQELLWLLDQMQPGNPVYNIPFTIRLSGNLDLNAIQESLNDLIQRHESLRTGFIDVRGKPTLKIVTAPAISLPFEDLSKLPQEEKDRQLTKLTRSEASLLFDLQHGPLLKTRIIKLGATEHVLLLTMHHIISDLWSVSIFVRELAMIYQAKIAGEMPTLSTLPVQYADFAHWQRASLQGDMLTSTLAYWKQKLSGAPPLLALPTDHPRPNEHSNAGGCISFTIPSELCEQLRAISRQEGVTLYATLLSAFESVLQRYSGQTDIIIGTPVAGRPDPALDGVIGFFAHPMILRTDLSGDPSFRDVLQQVWQVAMEGYAHTIAFAKILEMSPARTNKSYHPVYQVSFGYFNKWDEALDAAGVKFALAEIEKPATDFDLFLTLFNHHGGLRGVMEYSSALFDAETIQQLIDFYCATIANIANDLQTKLSQLSLPEALERKVRESRARQQKRTVAIAATFTAETIHDMLAFWLQKIGHKAQIEFAPYHQVFQQLLDPQSLLNQNSQGVNILLARFEDWLQFENAATDQAAKIEQNVSELIHAVTLAASHTATPYIVCMCPASPAIYADKQLADIHQHQEQRLADALADVSGVYVVQSSEIRTLYPVAQYYDEYTDREGHIPYTPVFFTALATMLARKMVALQNPPRKVVVLDCDQTLWQGICGEDGADGVILDAPRKALQEFMVEQQTKGRLLCLCSKNNEPDVWEVFERRSEMSLKREHLTAWRINWQPKSENLKDLARELNLGLDSFIFIDDNPMECAEVKANCPGVEVLLLPAEVERIPKFLAHIWSFDQLKVTQEDRQRTALYRQNAAREHLRNDSSSLDDFLAGLTLQVEIVPLQPEQVDRVAQLTQRTNQFNLTTIRRTEQEILSLVQSGELQCETISARDRFGDYGLVGVLMFAVKADAIRVDTFLLSCRAMGRRIEQQMLAHLAELAEMRGVETIHLSYHPTPKNQPALDFLRSVGKDFEIQTPDGANFHLPSAKLLGMRSVA